MSVQHPPGRRPGPTVRTRVTEVRGQTVTRHEDRLVTEEPLELRLSAPGVPGTRLGITMRTPGNDFDLAAGWVVHEGVTTPDRLHAIRYCTDVELTDEQEFNVVTVELEAPPLRLPLPHTASSACGVCGADVVRDVLPERVATAGPPSAARITAEVVHRLPTSLREAQTAFSSTGGLHAAGLFDADGSRVLVREDVGRHNGVDKVLGARYLSGEPVPPILVLSGRIGFELVQKAVVAGISAVVAVGAPSSLAVELAARAGLLLVGFNREDRFVVYAGADRLGV